MDSEKLEYFKDVVENILHKVKDSKSVHINDVETLFDMFSKGKNGEEDVLKTLQEENEQLKATLKDKELIIALLKEQNEQLKK